MADESDGFAPFRLRGGRYEQVGFPLEALPELARYERLLLDVARGLWRNNNPERQRLPRGFVGRLQLRLVRVEEGSVIPVLARPGLPADAETMLDGFGGVFEQAKNLVDATFEAIVYDEELPPELPGEVVAEFIRFGSGLRKNEQVEFLGRARTVVYDRSVRKRFLKRTATEQFSVEGIELGRVTVVDADAQEFGLTDLRGRLVRGKYTNSSLTVDFRRVLDSRNLASVVRVEGVLAVNERDETLEVEDVRSVEVFELPEFPWSSRLLELAALSAGWLDGNGKGVAFVALDFARDVLREVTDRGISVPGIFPMPDGGVQLEWQNDPIVTSVEVTPDLDVFLYRLDVNSGNEDNLTSTDVNVAADFIAGGFHG